MLALGSGELLLRLLPDVPPVYYRKTFGDELYQHDPYLGWQLVPNSRTRIYSPEYDFKAAINSQGIRGPEIPAAMPGECRILILGDSFVAGFTVDYKATFGQVLQRLLEQSGNRTCRVLSIGVDGYSTDQELLLLEKMAPELAPTLTILFFFFNDVYCNLSTSCSGQNKPVFLAPVALLDQNSDELVLTNVPVPEKRDKQIVPKVVSIKEPESDNLSLRQWLQKHSHLYRLLRREAKIALGHQERIPLRSEMFITPLPERFHVFRYPYDETTKNAWRITEKLIMQVQQTAQNNGSEFMLFHVPMRETIYQQEWDTGLQAHNLDSSNWNKSQVEIELRKICVRNNLECILPAERFRLPTGAEPGKQRFYLTNDPHWNEAGHELTGRILAESIHAALERATGN